MKKKLYLSVLLGTMLLTCACGSKEDIVTDTNSGQETNATVMTEVAQTEVTEVLETEAPDLSNENGYGFTISEACFEAYLSYVESGYAASVYKDAEHDAGGMDENLFGYFSICGMDKVTKEPFLLLSSTNNNDYCGDEIYFCRYNGKSRAGEGIPEVGCLGNFDIMLDEMYGMGHMWAEKNTLYVYTKKPGVNDYYNCPFLHREDLYYASAEEYEYTLENVGPDGKKGNSGYSVERVEEMLANGELAHIQWFSIEDIDSARAYYQEYVHGYIYTGSGTVANRDDYYNDTTPLKYIPYIESGVFALDERNGKVIYEFNNLDSEARNAVIYWGDHDYMKSDIQFRRGSDTTEVAVDIYDLGDGNWKAIARSYVLEKYGYCVRIEELSEEEVLSYYSYSDSSLAYPQEERQEISSVAELLQIYGKN